tara:strand:+ start:161 stop:631 length:471 start_codon:yes stop_codon:yes gene_type:complete
MKFGAIYKFVCRDKSVTEFYIGSTKNLQQRIYHHKSSCHNSNGKEYNLKVYQFIRENGGWENWEIVVIKKLPNTNKEARCYIEQFYKNLYKPTLNSRNAMGYDIEREKEWQKNYDKNYRIENKDKIKAREKLKAKCPICDLEMTKHCIKRHIKRKH